MKIPAPTAAPKSAAAPFTSSTHKQLQKRQNKKAPGQIGQGQKMTDIIIRAGKLTPYWPRGRDVCASPAATFLIVGHSVTPIIIKCKVEG